MFTFFSDPGHGWLCVTAQQLRAVGLSPVDFTTCSYVQGTTLYLEEDCDAPKFIEIWQRRFGSPKIIDAHQEQTFIRDLPSNHAGRWQPFKVPA